MKTIRELADELGVSKQTIRNTIKKLGLQSSLRKKKNAFAIDEQQEKALKREIKGKQEQENEKQVFDTLQSDVQSILRYLQSQLKEKDQQLSKKDEQISNLQRLLDQQQQLQAGTQRQLDQLKIEYKGNHIDKMNKEPKEATAESLKKGNFLKRLFKIKT